MGVILVDPRVGSKIPGQQASHDVKDALLRLGAPCREERLAAGDVSWEGVGSAAEAHRPIFCGAEIKAISDLLACITSGRFATNQLPGMIEGYEVRYLLVVGPYRPGADGSLEVPRAGGWQPARLGNRSFRYDAVSHWLSTMEEMAGIRVRRVYDKRELAEEIHCLWAWWEKGIDSHTAHKAIYKGKLPARTAAGYAPLTKPSMQRMMLMQLPGVSDVLSERIEDYLDEHGHGPAALSESEWKQIEGVGPKLAARLHTIFSSMMRRGVGNAGS